MLVLRKAGHTTFKKIVSISSITYRHPPETPQQRRSTLGSGEKEKNPSGTPGSYNERDNEG
jgi:hypothetical protein